MTYFHPTTKLEAKVELPRRCLQIVSGAARWEYLHSIQAVDIVD